MTTLSSLHWNCRCQVVVVTEGQYREAVGDGRVAGQREMNWETRTQGWILPPEAKRSLEEFGRLDLGDGLPVDVRAPVQKTTTAEEKAAAYQWHPGDLRISLKQLKARYDAETFALFKRRAQQERLQDGRTVWDWLEGQA